MTKEQTAPEQGRKLQQTVYAYAFWIALSASVILVFCLYYFGRGTAQQDQIFSIAASLAASILFAIVFTLLVNREFANLIRRLMREEGHLISCSVIEEINSHYKLYVPSDIYLPTIGIDPSFNADLTADLKESSFYLFKGISAKYVPARLMYSDHHLSILKVLILDPRDAPSVSLRAKDRAHNPLYPGQTMNERRVGLERELYMGIIALFDCKHICPIEIAYGQGTSVIRLEVFDRALYLSLYHSSKAALSAFPETIRYTRDSMLYDIYRIDSFRTFDISEERIRFDSTTSEKTLLEHLELMGMKNASHEELEKYRQEFRTFAASFAQKSRINTI